MKKPMISATILTSVLCTSPAMAASSSSTTFQVSATVDNACSVSSAASTATLAAGAIASGGIDLTCTPGTAYQVGLNAGTATGAVTAQRIINGTETLSYKLDRDLSHVASGQPKAYGVQAVSQPLASRNDAGPVTVTVTY